MQRRPPLMTNEPARRRRKSLIHYFILLCYPKVFISLFPESTLCVFNFRFSDKKFIYLLQGMFYTAFIKYVLSVNHFHPLLLRISSQSVNPRDVFSLTEVTQTPQIHNDLNSNQLWYLQTQINGEYMRFLWNKNEETVCGCK